LLSYDSLGYLRGFLGFENWEIIWDSNKRRRSQKKFWMIGMIDYDVIGADLSLNDYEPTCSPKPQINFYTLTFPLIEIQPIELNDKYQQILLHSLKIKHEKFRNAH